MTDTRIKIWNVFHDGGIKSVERPSEDSFQLGIDIEYLRERFDNPGELILVTLIDCQGFQFRFYDSDRFTTDLAVISEARPGILNAEMDADDDQLLNVWCDNGVLQFKSSGFSLKWDRGDEITFQELVDVATKYWDEFGK